MKRWLTFSAFATIALLLALPNPTARAATLNRAWVSGHGADAAGCGSPASPCRSLQYAHDNAVGPGGEIDILDPAGYGALHITKAVSVVNDGVGTAGVQSTSGIAIKIDAGPTDSIYLRGLNVDGANNAATMGIQFNTGASLTIAGCVLRHFKQYGIAITPGGNDTRFNIYDVVSSDNQGGLLVRPQSGAFNTDAVIDHATFQNNAADGVTLDASATNGALISYLFNSDSSNNAGTGLAMHSFGSPTVVMVSFSEFGANNQGITTDAHSGVYLSYSLDAGNPGGDINDGGDVFTYGNNVIGSIAGTPLTHLAPD